MMFTEAEQLSLSRARKAVRMSLAMALDQLPEDDEEFVTKDVVTAALLALSGGGVSTYLELVQFFARTQTEMEN
jgi:hypothetical protein